MELNFRWTPLLSIFGYFLPPISDFLSNEIGAILAPSCLFMFLFLFSEYSTYSYGVRVKAPGPLSTASYDKSAEAGWLCAQSFFCLQHPPTVTPLDSAKLDVFLSRLSPNLIMSGRNNCLHLTYFYWSCSIQLSLCPFSTCLQLVYCIVAVVWLLSIVCKATEASAFTDTSLSWSADQSSPLYSQLPSGERAYITYFIKIIPRSSVLKCNKLRRSTRNIKT